MLENPGLRADAPHLNGGGRATGGRKPAGEHPWRSRLLIRRECEGKCSFASRRRTTRLMRPSERGSDMELAGLVKIESDQPELIDHAARVISESFLEEPWYEEWLKAIDGIGATRERKLEIVTAAFRGEFRTHAAYPAVYATEDFAAIAGVFLASELRGATHDELEEEGFLMYLPDLLTEEEMKLLAAANDALTPVSEFSWIDKHVGENDYIYVYGWAVDSSKRGSGAFRRMVEPLFDKADELGVDIYLECYSDRLQSLYEHVGFEVIETVSAPDIPIVERCMVRRAKTSRSR